ncbi:MAG: lysophospholipid acyltransferase family protein [Alphaproteobacteria bacterium]|nr:lysophospholipid acyltransferase family protein [Alphaproteobacteria bacterium]
MSKAPPEKLALGWRLRYGAEAALFFAFMGLFRMLNVDAASALGGFIGRNILAHTSVTRRARDNLIAAYPQMGAAERNAVIKEMWDNLGRTVAEYAHLDAFRIGGENPRVEFVNRDLIEQAKASGKGVIFFSGHLANWEIMPVTTPELGVEGALVYRPVNNPYVDRWTSRQRTDNGPSEAISKGAQGTRRIFTLLRGGKGIFILVDQKTNEGIPAQFFGRMAMTTPAPAVLALRLGAVLMMITNERLNGAHFRVTAHEPIAFTPTGDHDRDVLALTQKINDGLEAVIRQRPSQWLWIHRRWPKMGDKPRSRRGREAQALGGSGVGVDSDGSSLS